MKVYQQGGNNRRKDKSSMIWYIVLLVITLAIIATSIALAVGKDDPVVDTGSGNEIENEINQPVTSKPVTYVLPFEQYTVAREASLDSLVYMPSINMWKTHNGVDFLPGGDASVRVMADGTVSAAEQTTLEGWIVTVTHADGMMSHYKSLSEVSVKSGDKVTAGSVIGKAGSMITETDIGDHVHLELTKNGKLVDPLSYLDTNSSK